MVALLLEHLFTTRELKGSGALDLCWPWQEKKVRRKYQSPWITRQVLDQLRIRDSLLKTARRLNTGKSWTTIVQPEIKLLRWCEELNVIFISPLLKSIKISNRPGKQSNC